jgi:phosphatidylinositol glycan class B
LNTYRDQTDVFYASPISYLRTYFPPKVDTSFPLPSYPTTPPGDSAEPDKEGRYPWRHEWPSLLIFFGNLLDQDGVKGSFVDQGYTEVWRGGRSWEGDGKRRGGIRIWKWDGVEKRKGVFIQSEL